MIISASRRTDIPAFYPEWFMKRIEEGYFLAVNPFNPDSYRPVSLLPTDVDAIVFVSKNPGPILQHLDTLLSKGYRICFQYTLNDYPKVFEPRVPSLEQRIRVFQQLGEKLGPEKLIWRYDPIIYSNITPVDYHLESFERLSDELAPYTRKVVISFLDFYRKLLSRFRELEQKHGISIYDLREPLYLRQLNHLAENLGRIARKKGLEITTCSEGVDLDSFGIKHGACFDINYFNNVFGLQLGQKNSKPQRPGCLCSEAPDMGFYNTCRFACVYCYASSGDKVVMTESRKHRADSPALLGEYKKEGYLQPRLF